VTNQFFKFDFKFRALSDPRVDERMRMRSHMKMTTRMLSSLCYAGMTGFVTLEVANFND